MRSKITGTALCPRLAVFRSNSRVVLQLIDDVKGITVAAGTSADGVPKMKAAFATGKTLAESACAKGITRVVFDRGGYRYHGRVRAVADGAREGGLSF